MEALANILAVSCLTIVGLVSSSFTFNTALVIILIGFLLLLIFKLEQETFHFKKGIEKCRKVQECYFSILPLAHDSRTEVDKLPGRPKFEINCDLFMKTGNSGWVRSIAVSVLSNHSW